MTLEELEHLLPWGLHDAYVEQMNIDWIGASLILVVRIMMSENQDLDQRAEVILDGLVYVRIEGPEPEGSASSAAGLWVQPDAVPPERAPRDLPPPPAGSFVHQFHVSQWNRSFFVCARSAALRWLEPEPAAARAETRALFPGSSIPE
jgi:hypothetical protein